MSENYLIETEKSFLSISSFKKNEKLISRCVSEISSLLLERPEIIVFGKIVRQNRNVGFFSDESEGYKFSNKMMQSQPLTSNLKKLMEKINEKYNANFNGILINHYIDGNNVIGKHSDDETNLSDKGVVAISYGAERKFRIRNKITKKIVSDVPTEHCSILHMGGDFQKEFTHEIPAEKKIKEERYSFTFRQHLS